MAGAGQQAGQREAWLHQGPGRDLVATLDPGWGWGAWGAARGDIFREGQGLLALGLSGKAGPGAGSWAFPVDAESLLLGKSLPSGTCLMVR